MVTSNKSSKSMFSFKVKLFFNRHAIDKKGDVSLYLEVSISYVSVKSQRKRFPLKLRWPNEFVDLKSNTLLKRMRRDPDVNDYNMIITSEISKMNEIAKKYRLSDRILNMDSLKRELLYFDKNKSVVAFMKSIRRERYKNGEIVKRTYQNHLSTINVIINYSPLLQFNEIDEMWMKKFVNHLRKKKNKHNTIWARVKDLKAYLTIAINEFYIYVPDSGMKFSMSPIENESVYLFHNEVKKLLWLLDLSLSRTQLNVLKAFLFCCFTGIRISDVYKSEYNWLVSDNFIRFSMKKNHSRKPKTIMIPLIPIAKGLINNMDGLFFDLPTEQEYNRTLKELAEMAGINKNLTSHVARHTFGYLFMTSVGNIFALKKILGHSKIETTEKYAHVDDDYNFISTMRIQDEFEEVSKIKRLVR